MGNTNTTTTEQIESMTRSEVIGWLCQNVRNGTYSDEDCADDGIPVLTHQEAVDLACECIMEGGIAEVLRARIVELERALANTEESLREERNRS